MNKFKIIILILFLTLIVKTSSQQFNPFENFTHAKLNENNPGNIENIYLERAGAWPYGSSRSIAVDSLRDIIFAGSGGAVLILDGADKNNPVLITDALRTNGLVEEIFYDDQLQRLYLACGEGGFEIWDVQNTFQPSLLSLMEILYFNVETPVRDVQVKNDIAYLECSFGYVHSVNVSDPQNPYQVAFNGFMGNPSHEIHLGTDGRLHTTGAQEYVRFNIPPDGSLQSAGNKHFTYGADAVFGMENIAFVAYSGYMYILDLLLPGFPAWSITDVGGITEIEVRNDIAYIINDNGLQIWDVSNVQAPALLSMFTQEYDFSDIYLAGNYAYISARTEGFRIFDITDPANPIPMGTFDTFSSALDTYLVGETAYLADGEDGLLMIDISNLDYPELIGQYPLTEGGVYQVVVQNGIAYTACWTGGFRIVDVSNPASPIELSVDTTLDAWKLDVNGNYAYVVEAIANGPSYVHIYDISDPSNPIEMSVTEFPVTVYEVLYNNGYLYVSNENNGLRILDVSDPANPLEAASLNYPDAFDTDIVGNILYVCAPGIAQPDGGFYTVDISDPANPFELDMYDDPGFACFRVKVESGYAYITDGNDIHLLDVSNPSSINYLEEYRMPGFSYDLFVRYGKAYVADTEAGLQVLNNLQVVPVELVSFNAKVYKDDITLQWVTATETNNSGFEIERKITNPSNRISEWKQIGFVEGSGTSTNKNEYLYLDENLNPGTYNYRLVQVDYDGTKNESEVVTATVNSLPEQFSIEQNYPNPFNPATSINFTLPEKGFVNLRVFDILGNKVADLVNEELDVGYHSVEWEASDLSSGIYFYQLNVDNRFNAVRKMQLLK